MSRDVSAFDGSGLVSYRIRPLLLLLLVMVIGLSGVQFGL